MTDVIKPCPFCGAQPEYWDEPDIQSKWFHPGTITTGDCFLRGQGISDIELWNRRPAMKITPAPPIRLEE